MTEVRVDPDALDSLAHMLGNVKSALSASKRRLDLSGEALGSTLLATRLDAFFAHWERGLHALDADLHKAVVALQASAAHYRATESAITNAVTTP